MSCVLDEDIFESILNGSLVPSAPTDRAVNKAMHGKAPIRVRITKKSSMKSPKGRTTPSSTPTGSPPSSESVSSPAGANHEVPAEATCELPPEASCEVPSCEVPPGASCEVPAEASCEGPPGPSCEVPSEAPCEVPPHVSPAGVVDLLSDSEQCEPEGLDRVAARALARRAPFVVDLLDSPLPPRAKGIVLEDPAMDRSGDGSQRTPFREPSPFLTHNIYFCVSVFL